MDSWDAYVQWGASTETIFSGPPPRHEIHPEHGSSATEENKSDRCRRRNRGKCYHIEVEFLLTLRQRHQEDIEKVPLVKIIELLVTYILHLENCVQKKLINMILRFGFQKR